MYIRLDRAHRLLPVSLGVVTLGGVGVLLVWDAFPGVFPARSHDYIAAFPLALIALAAVQVIAGVVFDFAVERAGVPRFAGEIVVVAAYVLVLVNLLYKTQWIFLILPITRICGWIGQNRC